MISKGNELLQKLFNRLNKAKGGEKIFLPFSRWWGVGIIKKIMLNLKY